ncbi:alanine--tRNA ligase, mitochondrial [Xylocopa sonorina]|uniref:alanine--tRNA ligase, mitochondrial n=1 Tax=Xylocopa sonorina TaxID=1818115 RepID=UPI00403AF1E3
MNYVLSMRTYSSNTLSTIQKSAKLIRNEFLKYFEKDLGHTFIRSSPVISWNDHSVAFVNAGMNQFKGVFLDYYDPPVTKVANSQKCIRISGKHNDLDLVGNDSCHHTFFEMLGNWSFGDYFKENACRYAWNLLTLHYGINEELLYVTYFGGDENLKLPPDLECRDIWLSIGVRKDKILPFGLKDNFWEMGISGPCGPCTEIHIDHTKNLKNRSMQINKGYIDLTELWNIVFIQYERLPNGTIVPLPKHHVDTGMGFERLVALLQGKQSNYDTDLFQPLFKSIQKYTNAPEYKGTFGDNNNEVDYGYRVLADHSRMITVALADGVIPAVNNKLRKILRKSFDVGERIFKKYGVLVELSYAVAESLGDVYPELQNNLQKVQKIIQSEEKLYKQIQLSSSKQWMQLVEKDPKLKSVTRSSGPGLVSGYKYLQHTSAFLDTLPVDVAFKLYDAHGLSVKTIRELAKVQFLHFDEAALQKKLENLRNRSRVGLEDSATTALKKSLKVLEKNSLPRTDDSFIYKYVLNENNYEFPEVESKILALIINGNVILNKANVNTKSDLFEAINNEMGNGDVTMDKVGIILDKTLFHTLKDGQVSDKGVIRMKNCNFNVLYVQKIDGYVIHYGWLSLTHLKEFVAELENGNHCIVSIESEHRTGAMRHHTAAHLLNACIQQIIEIVSADYFIIRSNSLQCHYNSYTEKPNTMQLRKIEKLINNIIRDNVPVTIKELNAWELLADNSIALTPGQIYPYKGIRVVEINSDNLKSKEACYGTHVSRTGELEYFCLTNYSNSPLYFTLEAVVGPLATSAKLVGENIQLQVSHLEDKLKSEKITYEMCQSINNEIKELVNKSSKISVPFLVKGECLLKLSNLKQRVQKQIKITEHCLAQHLVSSNQGNYSPKNSFKRLAIS